MSPVEIWLRRVGWATEQVDIDKVFEPVPRGRSKVLLVENQDEYDYCWAMQMICGGEIDILLYESNRTLESYLANFSRVFTTWDPSDRNRI